MQSPKLEYGSPGSVEQGQSSYHTCWSSRIFTIIKGSVRNKEFTHIPSLTRYVQYEIDSVFCFALSFNTVIQRAVFIKIITYELLISIHFHLITPPNNVTSRESTCSNHYPYYTFKNKNFEYFLDGKVF